jgi:hypothetical protein
MTRDYGSEKYGMKLSARVWEMMILA